jgi:hypothetical protein
MRADGVAEFSRGGGSQHETGMERCGVCLDRFIWSGML